MSSYAAPAKWCPVNRSLCAPCAFCRCYVPIRLLEDVSLDAREEWACLDCADGIEQEREADRLRDEGCDVCHGGGCRDCLAV